MRRAWMAGVLVAVVAATVPISAQLGPITRGVTKAKDSLTFTEEEERQIGADVSAKLRLKYGVAQDAAIHRYVTLVGTLLGQQSTRPKLRWTFIVLDTDGINAFAAPGGFVHITRGALALIRNEAELADVLGHEISHITARHTLAAIRKGKVEGAIGKGATVVTRNDFLARIIDKTYSMVLENAFSSGEEEESDEMGVTLANAVGYAPAGLSAFLSRLADRNKGLTNRSGLFASHPQTKDRVEALTELIEDEKLESTATVHARYVQAVKYRSVGVTHVAQVPTPSSTDAKAAPAKTGLGKLGLGGLNPLGREKSSSNTIAATGSRGVNPDRDAKGGPNKALVVVTVSAAEIAAFKKGIVG